MSVTIHDVARQVNLSIATVSRALNRPESVPEPTRQRVLEAVRLTGYRPDAIGRSLREGRSRSVGLIVSDIRNPFYASITKAVEDIAQARGYGVLICNADEKPERAQEALHFLASHQVSGIIHVPTGENVAVLGELEARGVPIVDLDRVSGLQNAGAVLVNNRQGARQAAEHLIGLGHQRIATIAGPQHLTTGRERLEGFRQALEEAGIRLLKRHVEFGDFREASGMRAAQRLFALPKPPTALFVANNEMMAGALGAVLESGRRIPHDISLVGFDDARWAQYMHPPLTVVAQPIDAIGTLAAEQLFERIEGKPAARIQVLDTQLIVRASTGPPGAS
ncbi:LacI family transcriptional regulator (plasmid) [Deinococcus metallilatus]|uniref:LacI family transcriptional regulator n=1 Tax=Deinococcus metallilatus TaxID=1211322 RepID=A0AAJ5F7W1_9DEIO|nr:LacI family DNA-binding transcriptional regulator [Deinococcus metallilatus]MBB5293460.1 LacI family transcriptional regulator [Deinococcus metallilatus]QBY06546.1 LacI family transcriptional regulator [Deinococcus metallilatus]RXJ17889.1 LacI family transcriptional regulator [Deinococcus metallilatus]TLK32161.1 LacI family transcriptional regulator [Deinococcus metallilatus]GMA15320.1 LacI family transcriptional regulator [Deinococcus metallilatus]